MAVDSGLRVLVVEDNADHAEVILHALEHRPDVGQVAWVKDGEEALDFLHHRGPYADPASAPRPEVILLDLKLPKVGGHEVLRRIKEEPALADIPVVILSTTEREKDVAETYRVGAEGFLTKAAQFRTFIEKIRALDLPRLARAGAEAPPCDDAR
jgi:CheY-like chemotaxis protein